MKNFFEQLLELYSELQIPEEYKDLAKVDSKISWYLADHLDQYVSATSSNRNYIVEIDLKNAFYTICNAWFNPQCNFIVELNKLTDKKARNIFIATHLKNTEYLKRLNIVCKVIVMGILFSVGIIQLLELKKDGAIILCDNSSYDKLKNLQVQNSKFIQFIISKNFSLKVKTYSLYVRCNKTTFTWNEDELLIKGNYKYIPKKIRDVQISILKRQSLNLRDLEKIYSTKFLQIAMYNNLNQILRDYYLCDNNKYISAKGIYTTEMSDISPRLYLKIFIFPLLLATRL